MTKKEISGFQGAAFGFMDNAILILSLLIGVAEATTNPMFTIIAGLIGGIGNAFGNSLGFYASELAERGEQIKQNIRQHTMSEIIKSSFYAFIASIAMLVAVVPFAFFDIFKAMLFSAGIVLITLFYTGTYVGKISNIKNPQIYGLKYVVLAAMGAIISYVLGFMLRSFLV